MRVIAADKILADFGLRLWRYPQGTLLPPAGVRIGPPAGVRIPRDDFHSGVG